MKKRIIIYIVICQLTLVSIIVIQAYKKKASVNVSVTMINKSNLSFNGSDLLKDFYEPRPGVENFLGAGKINKDTLRDRFDYSIEKTNIYRIIALGDSWTYGIWTPLEEIWPERLEEYLKEKCQNSKFEVINLGVGGYDTRYEVERFNKRGKKYNPDLVIVFITDMKRILEKMELSVYGGQTAGEFLEARQKVIEELGIDEVYNYQIEALKLLDEYYDGKILFLSDEGRLINRDEKKILEDFVAKSTNKYFYDLNNSPLNISGAMIKDNGHPNGYGHDLIAKEVFGYLTSQIVSCY